MAWSDLFFKDVFYYKPQLHPFFFFFSSSFTLKMYADEDIIEDQFQIIQEESIKALEQVQLYQRKVMTPIWEKRREIVKSIPNFWSTAVNHNYYVCKKKY